VLSYDTTNFPTWTALRNERCRLAQRGHSNQKRRDLRQVGLSYAPNDQHGLSLCHHVYPLNVSDSGELSAVLPRIPRMLARVGIACNTLTLVMDKGSATLASSLELQRHGLHWVAALPWNKAPQGLRMRPAGDLDSLQPRQPGVKACAQKEIVHGAERQCALSHSASFAVEQLRSTMVSMAKAAKGLRRLSRDLAKPGPKFREAALRKRIGRLLAPNRVSRVLPWELSRFQRGFELSFESI